MNNSSEYTALSLLEKIIEFTGMTSEPVEWTFEEQSGNPPRLARLQQIQSLIEAFVPELIPLKDMRWRMENFFAGNFLLNRSLDDYSALLDKIENTIAQSKFSGTPKEKLDIYDLRTNYCDLLDFYLKMQKLLSHNLSYMEISYPYMFSYIVADAITGSIESDAETVGRMLVEFIDPKHRSFTEEELVEKFKYPAVSLLDLELDWM